MIRARQKSVRAELVEARLSTKPTASGKAPFDKLRADDGAWICAALLAAASLLALPATAQEARQTANFHAPVKTFGRVSYDARSLMIDGKRTIIWSSEMHASACPRPICGATCCRR